MRGDRRNHDSERDDFGESGRGLSSGLSWDLGAPAGPSGSDPRVQRDILSISAQLEPILNVEADPLRNKRSLAALGFSALGAVLLGAAAPEPLDSAIAAYRAGRMEEARALSEPLANSGDSKAATMMGYLFEQGLGGKKDEARAVAYYRQAAEKNDADALMALGRLGLDNKGQISPAETQSYLSRAADLGRADAAGLLGDGFELAGSMNFTRKGIETNDEHLIYRTDSAQIAERRLVLNNLWRTRLHAGH